MNKKECEILGYAPVTIKETHEEMFRICIAVDSNKQNYVGKEALFIFLPQEEYLELNITSYLHGSYTKCYYETTDNIVTGKTKVTKLNFE